jgi:hypothetical protein
MVGALMKMMRNRGNDAMSNVCARWRLGLVVMLVGVTAGCVGRAIREGVGVVTGASGKVVDISPPPQLTQYKGLRIEPITVSQRLLLPQQMPELVRAELIERTHRAGLSSDGRPGLVLTGEIIHYEGAGAVDTAFGPLYEVIIRSKLTDAESGRVLCEANLIGRSKATSASSPEDLAEGAGKALRKWLKQCGLVTEEEEKE